MNTPSRHGTLLCAGTTLPVPFYRTTKTLRCVCVCVYEPSYSVISIRRYLKYSVEKWRITKHRTHGVSCAHTPASFNIQHTPQNSRRNLSRVSLP